VTRITASLTGRASNASSTWAGDGTVLTTTWVLVIALAVGVAVVVELRGR
jgi:hypothetical protein